MRLDPAAPPLTSEHAELAERVSELPADALVFTSLTGARITSDEGWNYYSAVSGRQHYVAGWANSELRVRPNERRERLRLNRLALGGNPGPALADAGIASDRPLYAVLRAGEQAAARGAPSLRKRPFRALRAAGAVIRAGYDRKP